MVEADIIRNIVFLTSTVFFLLAVGMVYLVSIYTKRQKLYHNNLEKIRLKNEAELLKATLTVQENERERIGANLHDDIGPLLSSFKMYFKNELNFKEGEEKKEIEAILIALDENIEQVRDISRDLVPNVLYQFGIKTALQELKRRFEKGNSVSINIHTPDHLLLEVHDKLSLYRIIQESINNAIRHGNADIIDISITSINDKYKISIKDNGKGFRVDNNERGLGLRNMEARTKSMGALLSIESKPEEGSNIKISQLKFSEND